MSCSKGLLIFLAVTILIGIGGVSYYFCLVSSRWEKEEATVAILEEIAKDSDPTIRTGLLRYIRKTKTEVGFSLLVEGLEDPFLNVREEAESALLEIGPRAVPYILDAISFLDEDAWTEAKKILLRIGPSAIPKLVRELSTNDKKVLNRLTECLFEFGETATNELKQTFMKEALNGADIRRSIAAEDILLYITLFSSPPVLAQKEPAK